LSGIGLGENNLAGGNFAGQNLTNAYFGAATLTGADFTDAEVRGASFSDTMSYGFTLAQLYSTASYQAKDLSGIGLDGKNLAGGNFAGQNLTGASFYNATLAGADFSHANLTNAYLNGATLTGANFTAADARGASYGFFGSEITTNLIQPDGHISGLNLDAGRLLIVRDYDGNPVGYQAPTGPIPITVDQQFAMGPGGTLRMVFEADAWDSKVSFAPGIPVTLGGLLELTFADDVDLSSQLGRTFDLFDWTGVTPNGEFSIESPYTWDLSNLYTTGEVTLIAVPEPASFALAAGCALTLMFYWRRTIPRIRSGNWKRRRVVLCHQRRNWRLKV
jgi:hypothetical protein